MKNLILVCCIIWIFLIAMVSCAKLEPAAPANDQLLDGPIEGLTFEENQRFLAGDVAFNDEIFTSSMGLGPLFVTNSCGSCHAGDGKGHPFSTLTRFGQTDSTGNHFLHKGAPQLQNRALPGFQPEEIPEGATFSKFTPPANTGLGLIELVSDADIMEMADPYDLDGDGISGVPNWDVLPSYIKPHEGAITNNGRYICRFGKKGGAYNLLHQTVNAYNQDMGITSSYNPVDVYTGASIDPEVTTQTVNNVVFYLRTLKAPIQRTPEDAEITHGKNRFNEIGCGSCHKETLTTGFSPIAALSNKTFHPYTDLLLHDMGRTLDDGYTEGNAKTYEWRTPPLWGLGLSTNSQGGQYFLMHDGRAHSIEEAIEMHGGESQRSKEKFTGLSSSDKIAVIKFLKSL